MQVLLQKLLRLDKEDINADEKYFNTNIMNVIDHINSNIDSKEYDYKKFIEFSLKFTELYDIIYKLHKYNLILKYNSQLKVIPHSSIFHNHGT